MRKSIDDLLGIMAALRTRGTGCPWDLEQDFSTIAPHTLEEAYEVVDAIDRQDMTAIKEELGDLLFQVVFYARLAEERGAFDFHDVVDEISRKMLRRHPHVFDREQTDKLADIDTVNRQWEDIKAEEKQNAGGDNTVNGDPGMKSVLADIPLALPALSRAIKLQNRAARVGFDWPDLRPVFAKLREELDELDTEIASGKEIAAIEEEYGDVLFVLANVARHLKIHPEAALRGANNKFIRRFTRIEERLFEQGRTPEDSNLEEMDRLWDEAKLEEKRAKAAAE